MRLILLGPPGSGKGTQATLLCERLQLEHIGTGDLIRSAMEHHTPMGERCRPIVEAGGLVPDETVNGLIAEHFNRMTPETGFVMDGYPRTLSQAEAFDRLLTAKNSPLTAVLEIQVEDEEIIRRVGGRWSCPKKGCKATYHTENNPPRVAGICDRCGTELTQRTDDKPETLRHRLEVYHRDTEDLIPYYKQKGLLRSVVGHGGIEEIYNKLIKEILPLSVPMQRSSG